jgi:restriction system protein
MPRKSDFEELIEGSFKYPILGLVLSIIAAGFGIYLSNKSGVGTTAALFTGVYQMIGKAAYMSSVIFLIASAIGYIVQRKKRKEKAAFFDQKDTLAELRTLGWKEFEEFVGTLFEKLGYSVQVTGGLKDGGIDLTVSKGGKTHLVQCKQFRTTQVSLSMVRDFYGAMSSRRKLEGGFFVTTGSATLEARKFAEENSIELIDGAKLLDYIRLSKQTLVPRASTRTSSAGIPKTKICPDCGAPMVVRVAKKGVHANEPFWGCANYPKCKAIVSYEKE